MRYTFDTWLASVGFQFTTRLVKTNFEVVIAFDAHDGLENSVMMQLVPWLCAIVVSIDFSQWSDSCLLLWGGLIEHPVLDPSCHSQTSPRGEIHPTMWSINPSCPETWLVVCSHLCRPRVCPPAASQ